jgi:hypothetical protein
MTIPFNLDELRVMRKFDQYQPKRTDIKSYSRIKSNSPDLAISNTDMQAQRNATADQPEVKGICYGFTAK